MEQKTKKIYSNCDSCFMPACANRDSGNCAKCEFTTPCEHCGAVVCDDVYNKCYEWLDTEFLVDRKFCPDCAKKVLNNAIAYYARTVELLSQVQLPTDLLNHLAKGRCVTADVIIDVERIEIRVSVSGNDEQGKVAVLYSKSYHISVELLKQSINPTDLLQHGIQQAFYGFDYLL